MPLHRFTLASRALLKSVDTQWGEVVKKGDILARVESNQSLKTFNVVSPINGIVMARNTNVGDVVRDEPLFTISDLSEVWAEFHVFPSDLTKIRQGQIVQVYSLNNPEGEKLQMTEATVKNVYCPQLMQNSQDCFLPLSPLRTKRGSGALG